MSHKVKCNISCQIGNHARGKDWSGRVSDDVIIDLAQAVGCNTTTPVDSKQQPCNYPNGSVYMFYPEKGSLSLSTFLV